VTLHEKTPAPDGADMETTTLPGSLPGKALAIICAAALFALMMVTVIDVTGRNLFNRPLRGGYELSGLLLMSMFFLALPFATAADRHIAVNLVDRVLGPRGLHLLRQFYRLAGAVLLGFLCAYAVRKGHSSARYGDVTMFLRLPLAPFIYFAAGSLGLSGLVLAGQFLRGLLTRR